MIAVSSLLFFVVLYSSVSQAHEDKEQTLETKFLAPVQGHIAAWSPDGKRLAYQGENGIWVVEEPHFDHPRQLIRMGRGFLDSCRDPQFLWSPDGQQFAFVASRPGDGWKTIWMANADGSHLRDLLPLGVPWGSAGVRAIRIVAWLNNHEIVFYHHCGTGCVSLAKVRLVQEELQYESWGEFVLDGALFDAPTHRWMIAEMQAGGLGLIDGQTAVTIPPPLLDRQQQPRVIEAEGRYRSIVEGCVEKEDHSPVRESHFDSWAPNGKQALYTTWMCSQTALIDSPIDLFLWSVESDEKVHLLAHAGWAAWSPEGSKIAFLLFGHPRYDASRKIIGTNFAVGKPFPVSVGIMDMASQSVIAFIPLASPSVDSGEMLEWARFRPSWSLDGNHLVIKDTQGNLILVSADGKKRRNLSQQSHRKEVCEENCLQWAPSGKRFAVSASAPRNTEETQGVARFLPPVGKEEQGLSDAEIVDRYFRNALPASGDSSLYFLLEYIHALEALGKRKEAEEQYRQGIKRVRSEEKWREQGMERFFDDDFASFLCQQGREKEAAEFGRCAPATTGASVEEGKQQSWSMVKKKETNEHKSTKNSFSQTSFLTSIFELQD